MYVFLLLLGAVTSAAGLSLVASGVAQEGVSAVTPGMIAAVGGLVLVGLGVLVRELQRIEQALAARPMPRASRPGEAPAAGSAAERPSAPTRIPFPSRPKTDSRPQPAPSGATTSTPAQADDAFVRLREKFPRLESAPIVEETDVSLLPRALARAEEDLGEAKNVAAAGGGAGPARVAARLNMNARPSGSRERARGSVFDAFWPKGQRLRRDAQAAAAHAVASQPSSSVEPAQGGEAAPDTHAATGEPASPITVLKSGTVEGMSYTLYSDGSIEAQLPQGMVRFGSITELRNHIEGDS